MTRGVWDGFAVAKMHPTEITPEWLVRFAARHGWEHHTETGWWTETYVRDAMRVSVRWVDRRVTAAQVTNAGTTRRIAADKVITIKATIRSPRRAV